MNKTRTVRFNNKLLIIGFGAVGQALLPLLLKRLGLSCRRVTVIDFADQEKALRPFITKGLHFVRERITPLSLSRLLAAHVGPGDLIIDLAWSIDFFDIVAWAHNNEVLYLNASLESWDDSAADMHKSVLEKSLYVRYERLLPLAAKWKLSTTALVDHGANPGLVSHFVKQGLWNIAAKTLQEKLLSRVLKRKLERLCEEVNFAELSQTLGVKVIHCSEWDGQLSTRPKRPHEFVGTWSVEGTWEESISPSELGWGTHEKTLPPFATIPSSGPLNQIILPQMGMNTWVRSWVPHQEIVGMVITHGESFTLSHALTVRKQGRVVYRPTVHYAYMPCNDTLLSLHELRCRHYELHNHKRILTTEIQEGVDMMGALIMGHRYQAWWTGSVLSIEAARKLVPNSNATAIQVAAGVLAGALWVINNPRRGLCLPEDLPHQEILGYAQPYLGKIISEASDWTPLRRHRVYFSEHPEAQPDISDPWQFTNFILRP